MSYLGGSVFAAMFLALVATSCASNKNREVLAAPVSQSAMQVADDCSNLAKPSVLRELMVKQQDDGQSISLCDIAKQSSATVNIVFLTSPACTTCNPAQKSLNRIAKQNPQYGLYVGVPAKNDGSNSLAYTVADAKDLANRSDVLDDASPSLAKPILDVEGNIWVNSTVGSLTQTFPHALVFSAKKFQSIQESSLILGKQYITQPELEASLVQILTQFLANP